MSIYAIVCVPSFEFDFGFTTAVISAVAKHENCCQRSYSWLWSCVQCLISDSVTLQFPTPGTKKKVTISGMPYNGFGVKSVLGYEHEGNLNEISIVLAMRPFPQTLRHEGEHVSRPAPDDIVGNDVAQCGG